MATARTKSPVLPKTRDDWKAALIAAAGAEAFVVAVFQFQRFSKRKSGGSEFTRDMKEWFGWSPNKASRCAQIGEYYYYTTDPKGVEEMLTSMFEKGKVKRRKNPDDGQYYYFLIDAPHVDGEEYFISQDAPSTKQEMQ